MFHVIQGRQLTSAFVHSIPVGTRLLCVLYYITCILVYHTILFIAIHQCNMQISRARAVGGEQHVDYSARFFNLHMFLYKEIKKNMALSDIAHNMLCPQIYTCGTYFLKTVTPLVGAYFYVCIAMLHVNAARQHFYARKPLQMSICKTSIQQMQRHARGIKLVLSTVYKLHHVYKTNYIQLVSQGIHHVINDCLRFMYTNVTVRHNVCIVVIHYM